MNGNGHSFPAISHSRSRSEPAIQHSDLELSTTIDQSDESEDDSSDDEEENRRRRFYDNGQNGDRMISNRQINIPMHRQMPHQPSFDDITTNGNLLINGAINVTYFLYGK